MDEVCWGLESGIEMTYVWLLNFRMDCRDEEENISDEYDVDPISP
jgi:hypothetical protein